MIKFAVSLFIIDLEYYTVSPVLLDPECPIHRIPRAQTCTSPPTHSSSPESLSSDYMIYQRKTFGKASEPLRESQMVQLEWSPAVPGTRIS